MNKDNAKDYLPLVKALAEGKTIQFKSDDAGWVDVAHYIGWTMHPSAYRIKPEPREFSLFVNNNGEVMHVARDGSVVASVPHGNAEPWQMIKVREVIE